MFGNLKAIILWGYARNTWQYDVLVVFILAFIFLTPKQWFENKDMTHRPLLLTTEAGRPEYTRQEIELRVRAITENSKTEVLGYRLHRDKEGKVVAYEVDIR
ncbi:MAG: hypothetical protein ABIP75_00240 [Pyrinomonadaceae bacterium]